MPTQRLFQFLVISLICLYSNLSVAQSWFTRSLVGMEVGPTGAHFSNSDTNDTVYASKFNGRDIVKRSIEANAQYLVMWVRDGDYAYYDSKILLKAPALGSRDPLREAVEEARKHKLPIISYCVVQQGGHFLNQHPEWQMKAADGKALGRYCFNSGYLEAMKAIASEQLKYGIAGFHIDMLDQGFGQPYGCWCDVCQKLFKEKYGHSMPSGVTWDEAWRKMLNFRYQSSERFEKALTAHIKSLNPQATVDYNYHGNPPFSFEVGQRPVQHANNGDFVTGETGAWGFSALTVGLNAEFYRAATPGIPYQVAMQRGVRMYHDQTTRPLADLRWELLNLLSHGAFVTMVDKTAYDGWLDPIAYERNGAAFEDALARRKHLGFKPVQDVGIYFSSSTRDWVGRDKPQNYFQAFLGAHKALAYNNIPWGIVLDENATLQRLQNFPVVLLPNTSVITAAEAETLNKYVDQGGKLIVTGLTGTHNEEGQFSTNSALTELIGGQPIAKLDSLDNWMRFTNNSYDRKTLRGSIPINWPFLVKGPATVWQATSALTMGELLKPARTPRQLAGKEGTEWPMSAGEAAGPAILIHRVGKGVVLTFATSPDFATASEHYITETRQLLVNSINYVHPKPRVKITAPAFVESVVTDDSANRKLRIHFLGYSTPPQTMHPQHRPLVLPNPMEDLPLFQVSIQTTNKLRGARSYNSSTQLKREGNRVSAIINDVQDVIILSY